MIEALRRAHARIAPPCQPRRSRLLWALGLAAPLLLIALRPAAWPSVIGLYLLAVAVGYTHPVCRATRYQHHDRHGSEET